jgi:transposase
MSRFKSSPGFLSALRIEIWEKPAIKVLEALKRSILIFINKNLLSMQFNYFLAVDISKAELYVLLRTRDRVLWRGKVENHYSQLKTMFKNLKKEFKFNPKECLVSMEATGMYNFHLLLFLNNHQIPATVIASQHIKNSLGMQRGKSDPIDAYRIADYTVRFLDKIELWTPPRKIITQLQVLLKTRDRLIDCRGRMETPINEMKLFISTSDYRAAKSVCQPVISELNKAVDAIDQEISDLLKSDEALNTMYKRLTSIQGVGFVIATTYIAATNEFKDFENGKKLACHSGVAPFSYGSGPRMSKAHISKRANLKLKTLLDLGARSAVLCKQGEFREYYHRKLAEGKPPLVIRNAIRNKIILRMVALIQNNTMYEKNYHKRVA